MQTDIQTLIVILCTPLSDKGKIAHCTLFLDPPKEEGMLGYLVFGCIYDALKICFEVMT